MTLGKLLKKIDKTYPETLSWSASNGDGLAKFITAEIEDTFDESNSDFEVLQCAKNAVSGILDDVEEMLENISKLKEFQDHE